jgi:hypothetical protein
MGYGPSRQMRGAGNHGDHPVQFKYNDAQRIANVVGKVEGARRGRQNSTLPRAAGAGGGSPIQRANWITAPGQVWRQGSSQTVTLAEDTTQTVSATLVFRSMTSSSFVVSLAITTWNDPATGNKAYYVLASDCG